MVLYEPYGVAFSSLLVVSWVVYLASRQRPSSQPP